MKPTFSPRRIVVTGVTSGLGGALARGFARAGHTVSGCGRTAAAIAECARELPAPHAFAVVDLNETEATARWAEQVLDLGVPDLLINNAAVIHRPARLWEITEPEFRQVIETNILAVHRVCRVFVPAMIAAARGVIVNVSSGWGRAVDREVSAYCTSKWAIEGLSKALAAELPSTMAAVPWSPGVIDTPMLRRVWGAEAGSFPDPATWAARAVPALLALGPKDSGRSLGFS